MRGNYLEQNRISLLYFECHAYAKIYAKGIEKYVFILSFFSSHYARDNRQVDRYRHFPGWGGIRFYPFARRRCKINQRRITAIYRMA